MVTVPTTETPPPPCGPRLESLSHIDISKLSQSELHALSLCSDATFDLRRTKEVVIPQIDRSVFNESAGSRRQTYSRHSSGAGLRCRLPGLLPNPRPLPNLSADDPERAENRTIVNFLKDLITSGKTVSPPSPQPVVSGEGMQMAPHSGEKKRKRERKPNPVAPITDIRLEIVNKNGVVVDLKALENADELYGTELRRRTAGLESEEGFLGFLSDLEGQWGSRRKKRRIVDASEFGDWFPTDWKLLLALKRREGRVSVYCRRYVSPTGQQFASCKEASSFLQSYFGLNDASQQLDQTGNNNKQCAGVDKNGNINQDSVPKSMVPNKSIPLVKEMDFSLMGIENLSEVQVRDLFECYNCNMTFDEKHQYMKHLMTFHRRTTRSYRLGSSIGEGVIIRQNGKYECQICHKVFQERRSYNGHVGVHVRSHVRHSEKLPGEATVQKRNESLAQDKLPPRISKMDALIEIAQNSIPQTSSNEPNKINGGSSPHTMPSISEHHAVNSENELGSVPNDLELEDCMTESIPDQGSNQNDGQWIISHEEKADSVDISHVENKVMSVCTGTFEHTKLGEVEKHGNSEQEISLNSQLIKEVNNVDNSHIENSLMAVGTDTFEQTKLTDMENSKQEIGFNSQLTPSRGVVAWTSGQTVKKNVMQSGVADSSMTMVQSVLCFPTSTAISNKGKNEFCTVFQKLDNVTGFDELRLEEMEPLDLTFMNRQESPPFPGVSMNVGNDEVMEEVFNSSARFESEAEAIMLNFNGRRQFKTVCVWCRTEFNQEAFESETQSDSVGFMCPSCKAKISGQLNVLDGGLSMNYRL